MTEIEVQTSRADQSRLSDRRVNTLSTCAAQRSDFLTDGRQMFVASIVERGGRIMHEKPYRKGRGRSFEKGQSGNPSGRPKGARNRTTLAAEALLDGEAETLIRKALKRALEDDDNAALRMCLDRVVPVRRDRRVSFTLPPLKSPEDIATATEAILVAVASGEVSPSEAADITKLIETRMKAIELVELEQRITLLEMPPAKRLTDEQLDEMLERGNQLRKDQEARRSAREGQVSQPTDSEISSQKTDVQ